MDLECFERKPYMDQCCRHLALARRYQTAWLSLSLPTAPLRTLHLGKGLPKVDPCRAVVKEEQRPGLGFNQ